MGLKINIYIYIPLDKVTGIQKVDIILSMLN